MAASIHAPRAKGVNVPLAPKLGSYLHWINASSGEDVLLIAVEDVRYFRSDTKYTRVVGATREGLIRKTLKALVAELDPAAFRQVHRAIVVNLNAVESVGHDEKGRMVLRLRGRSEVLHVSQPYSHTFRQM